MDEKQMTAAFNEWMRRYTEEPERFEREFQTVSLFLKEQASGMQPTYGSSAAAMLLSIHHEISAV